MLIILLAILLIAALGGGVYWGPGPAYGRSILGSLAMILVLLIALRLLGVI